MQITREMAHKLAVEHGLVVKKGVTKDLDFLVVADPDSMSGKAKKAREYSTKVDKCSGSGGEKQKERPLASPRSKKNVPLLPPLASPETVYS